MPRLILPPSVKADATAVEVLRVWLGESDVHCAFDINLNMDEEAEVSEWGILLARVIRRVASSLEREKGLEGSDVVTDIVESLLLEVNSPSTDEENES